MEVEYLKAFYKKRFWKMAQKNILKRDHYLCQDCLKKGIKTEAVVAHHLKSPADYPQLAFNGENLVSLCEVCHHKRHGGVIDF